MGDAGVQDFGTQITMPSDPDHTAPTAVGDGTVDFDDALRYFFGARNHYAGSHQGLPNAHHNRQHDLASAADHTVTADVDFGAFKAKSSAVPTVGADLVNKTYADALIAANDAMVFKGVIDCSANPNYPAASRGDTYRVSVAGKIGGASGTNVEAGDLLICLTDGTAAGTQAAVGAQWEIAQANIDGAVTGPASSTDSALALFNGTAGKTIKDSAITVDTDGTLAANSDTKIATQKAVKTAVAAAQAASQPLDATLTALAGMATAAGKLAYWTGADVVALTDLSAFIRTLLDDADAATARGTIGAETAGAAAAAQAASQPLDSDLTAIAALSTTAFGRNLLALADAAALQALLVGTGVTQLAAGNDPLAVGYNTNGWPSQLADSNSAWLAANRATYTRFIAAGYATTTFAGRVVTSSGNISGGTYGSTGSARTRAPNTRSQTSGTLACPASGDASFPLGGSVTPALTDFVGFSCDNATAVFIVLSNAGINVTASGVVHYQETAHPLPSTATPVAQPAIVRAPWMGGP